MKNKIIEQNLEKFRNEAMVPFWMWNDKLETKKLVQQLQSIKQKGMNQVIIHPRWGLSKDTYLKDQWYKKVGTILQKAQQLEMGIWIYDELNWPSGYAGGKILKKHPQLQAKNIIKTKEGFKVQKTNWQVPYSKQAYVNLLNPKVTDLFIKFVYQAYWKRLKKYFGKTLYGFFTDEPGFYNNFSNTNSNSLPWSDQLPEYFKNQNGYEIKKALKQMWKKDQKSISYKIDYWTTISSLYQENYFKKIQKWCHRKDTAVIGHVLGEESLIDTAKTQGNFFCTMKYLDMSGYDMLSNLNQTSIITSRLAYSAKKHYNLAGVCAETFGVFGNHLTTKEIIKIAKWQIKQGLDVLVLHALFYSQRGQRKADAPPSFFKDKYWSNFKSIISEIKEFKKNHPKTNVDTCIYYPIKNIWGAMTPNNIQQAKRVEKYFKKASYGCYNCGIQFDYLPPKLIEKVSDYKEIIIPGIYFLPLKTARVLKDFIKNKGKVIFIGKRPDFVFNHKENQLINYINNHSLLIKADSNSKYFPKLDKIFKKIKKRLFQTKIKLPPSPTGIERELKKAISQTT